MNNIFYLILYYITVQYVRTSIVNDSYCYRLLKQDEYLKLLDHCVYFIDLLLPFCQWCMSIHAC